MTFEGLVGGTSFVPQIREVMRAAVILDFPGIGVLIWMAARGRRGTLANGSAKELESAQVVTSKI